MAVIVSPFGPKPQFLLSTGLPAVANKLFFYVGGSVGTKQNTYTDSTGGVANTNPLILNSLGEPTTEIWFTAGLQYKVVYAPSTDTDPPTSPIWSIDHLTGVSDSTATQDQWVVFSGAPTYVGATSFTLAGDQTGTFQVGRRIKSTNSGGTIYSTITVSAFAAVTTVTVVNDSGVLDVGLSAVSYGLISATSTSLPMSTIASSIWTLRGSLTALIALAARADVPSGQYAANQIAFGYTGGTGRVYNFGADTVTKGGFQVYGVTSDLSASTLFLNSTNAGIIRMPAYGAGTATFDASGIISSVSDETYKVKDGAIKDPIPMLMALEPGYYFGKPEANMGVDRHLGFYAQNVRKALGPEAAPDPQEIMELDLKTGEERGTGEMKPWGYYDRSVLAVAIEAGKAQQITIKAQDARIAKLEETIKALTKA